MPTSKLPIPADPLGALAHLRENSIRSVVMVLKRSPTCPISHAAEAEWRNFLPSAPAPTLIAEIDVLAEKGLARGLTAALGVRHESPQVLVFANGDLVWHASHDAITEASLYAIGLESTRRLQGL